MDQQCFPIQPLHWLTELWSTPEYDTVNDSNSSGVWNACFFQIDNEPWHYEPRHHPDRHKLFFAGMHGGVCVCMCVCVSVWQALLRKKAGQIRAALAACQYLWLNDCTVHLVDVGRYFDQASQIHITSCSVVIQLLCVRCPCWGEGGEGVAFP